jgi:hypothetical protein
MRDMKNKTMLFLRPIAICLLGLVCWLAELQAQETAMGAASFIRLGSSARAIAMGRAFTALAGEDAVGMFWNPAGVALASKSRMGITDRLMEGGDLGMDGAFSFVSAGYSRPIGGKMAAGLGVMYYGVEGIEQYDTRAMHLGDFSDNELLLLLSLARLEGPISLGINVKFIRQEFKGLENDPQYGNLGAPSASGVGFDVGLITHFWRPLRIGVMLRGKTDLRNDRVPTSASVGLAYEKRLRLGREAPRVVLAVDLEQVKTKPIRLHMGLGLERLIAFRDIEFSIRGGRNNYFLEQRIGDIVKGDFKFKLEGEDQDLLNESNARWGMGIGIKRSGLGLDYTFTRGVLHDPHYLSLTYHY